MINERKLTEKELEKREIALKGLLQNKQSLVKTYGKDAEKVMYGIATKQAKNEVETMNLDKVKEAIGDLDIGSRVKIAKDYGGGTGTVEDIKGSFVTVKTKDGGGGHYHESNLKVIKEKIKELVIKQLTKEDNDPSGEYLEGDPDEHVEEGLFTNSTSDFNKEEIKVIADKTKTAVEAALNKDGNKFTIKSVKSGGGELKNNEFLITATSNEDMDRDTLFHIKNKTLFIKLSDLVGNELVDVDVKPTGEAVVNVDELTKKLSEYFKENFSVSEDMNDPVLMRIRAIGDKPNINPDFESTKNASKIKVLLSKKAEIMRDMEQEAEPEGGPIADKYGRMLTKVDDAIEKLGGNPMEEGKIKENTTQYKPFIKGETRLNRKGTETRTTYTSYLLEDEEQYNFLIENGVDAFMEEYDLTIEDDFGPDDMEIAPEDIVYSLNNKDSQFTSLIDEDLDVGHEDNEPKMLKAELARAGQMIQMLYKAIHKYDGQGEVDFPQWWQKKIIQANAMLDSAFDYLSGKEKVAQIDAMLDSDHLSEVTTNDEFRASQEDERLENHPEKDRIKQIQAMMQAMGKDELKKKIKEKLTKKSEVGDFVDDFMKSDAKQFKGKSKKKIKDMAVAAYLAKQNGK